jgi:hypothetical protein
MLCLYSVDISLRAFCLALLIFVTFTAITTQGDLHKKEIRPYIRKQYLKASPYLIQAKSKYFPISSFSDHVRWVPCHHGMARPQVADGGDALQFRRAAANILNKQSRTADKGWSSSLGVGRGANNSSP